MNRSQRIIWSNSGTLVDLSVPLGDFRSASTVINYETSSDIILIGTEFPINGKYFSVDVPSDIDSTPTVYLWDGSDWRAAVDVVDETNSMRKSGLLTFSMDIDHSGMVRQRVSSQIPELVGTTIYNLYWTKLVWSVDWNAATAVKYVGHLFSNDAALFTAYPDLNSASILDAYETSKTDWVEQGASASEAIIRELRRRNVIVRPDQIYDPSLLLDANVHKTAEIIYGGLGSSYVEAKKRAADEYVRALDLKHFEVDMNADGDVSPAEKSYSQAFLTR